jgi:hypothetical protein
MNLFLEKKNKWFNYRIWHPNFETVPTPVRSFLLTPCSMTSFTRLRYWYSSCLSIRTKEQKLYFPAS